MNRGFPIRVNKKDANKHFHRPNHRPKFDSDVKIFSQGARQYLHPSLSVLDRVDCELVYFKTDKIMVVSYDADTERVANTDYTGKVYRKCVMSGEVKFITDIINEYIEDKRKEREEYNNSINSDVQSEPIDITIGDYT
jgi:hypothetical protein